jgi:hypothetical protein
MLNALCAQPVAQLRRLRAECLGGPCMRVLSKQQRPGEMHVPIVHLARRRIGPIRGRYETNRMSVPMI